LIISCLDKRRIENAKALTKTLDERQVLQSERQQNNGAPARCLVFGFILAQAALHRRIKTYRWQSGKATEIS